MKYLLPFVACFLIASFAYVPMSLADEHDNKTQDQQQEQAESENNAQSKTKEGHEPENFFWEFGLNYMSYNTEIGGLDSKSNTLLLNLFPVSYFLDSLKEGSIGFGFLWFDYILGKIEDGNYKGSWGVLSQSLIIQYVLPHQSNYIFIPYLGFGSGTTWAQALDESRTQTLKCDYSGRVNKTILGVKIAQDAILYEGSGFSLDFMYNMFPSSEWSGKCEQGSLEYDSEIEVKAFSGFTLSLNYMW